MASTSIGERKLEMLFAVDSMDPTLTMIFYGLAVVCFIAAAVGYVWGKVSLVGLGLALFVFPSFWDALAAS
jgi:hypothetical protein